MSSIIERKLHTRNKRLIEAIKGSVFQAYCPLYDNMQIYLDYALLEKRLKNIEIEEKDLDCNKKQIDLIENRSNYEIVEVAIKSTENGEVLNMAFECNADERISIMLPDECIEVSVLSEEDDGDYAYQLLNGVEICSNYAMYITDNGEEITKPYQNLDVKCKITLNQEVMNALSKAVRKYVADRILHSHILGFCRFGEEGIELYKEIDNRLRGK